MKLLTLALAGPLLTCTGAIGEVKVTLTQRHGRTRGPAVLMSNGAMSYDVALVETKRRNLDPENMTLNGLGLFPSKRGWSGIGNLLVIKLDDEPLMPCPFKIGEMSSGDEGVLVLQGTGVKADARITFRTREQADNIFMSLHLMLKKRVTKVTLDMCAYPGEFSKTAVQKKLPLGKVNTVVLTAKGLRPERRAGTLDLVKEPWVYLYDTNYDPAKNRQVGGEMCACGILYNPMDMEAASFQKSPGAARLHFELAGGDEGAQVSTDFVLWEFMNSNEIGLKTMQSIVLRRE